MSFKSMLRKTALGLLFFTFTSTLFAQLGTWRDYLNYNNALHIDILGDEVYVASENGLFIYNQTQNEITRLSKVTGLSDIGITAMRANPETGLVFIGYENGNIDLLQNRTITNFTALKNSSVIGDKSIRHIQFYENQAFISTGLGVISFNTERVEVSDTYEILPTGAPAVNETTVLNDTLFAATSEGLYKGSLSTDLTIFANWEADLSVPVPFESVNNVSSVLGILYINYRTGSDLGVYRRDPSGWTLINGSGDILELTESISALVVNTSYFVDAKNPDGSSRIIFDDYDLDDVPMRASQVIQDGEGNLWIADSQSGLIKFNDDEGFEFIQVSGPGSNRAFRLQASGGNLWVASGFPQHPGNWNNSFVNAGFYGYIDGQWENYLPSESPIFSEEGLIDMAVAYPDPDDPAKVYAGSWRGGVAVAKNGEFSEVYDDTNSSLQGREEFPQDDQASVYVSDIVKDQDGNFWFTNGYADEPLSRLAPDGSWQSYELNGNFDAGDVLIRAIVSQDGNVWMLQNRNGVVVFNPDETDSDNDTRTFRAGEGSGGLPVNEVYSIAEDLDGEIWVGSADGVAVFFSPFDAFTTGSDARQILVEQDGIFQFLLEAQSVSAIAIDGANRKWIGTFGSGVFLLSEDGTEQILRFTADQSPLFSDVINDIAIDPETGEVFIATLEGIVSYMGDAIQGSASNECLTVYPNPVRETYSGPITIEGVMRDSEIKITDTRGNLIKSLESNGGRAIWDGKNIDGQRVATGVYFALVSNDEADSECVSKVLMIK
jgi:ligand-binding sensor domain-containing protein